MQTSESCTDTVAGYVESELTRMEALLAKLSAAAEAGRLAQARTIQRSFEAALESHVRTEEDLLLPVFELRTGVVAPAASLRAEHRDAERGVVLMRAGLAGSDVVEFREGLSFLREVLADHHSKEHILYSALDLVLSQPELGHLMKRLQRPFPAAAS